MTAFTANDRTLLNIVCSPASEIWSFSSMAKKSSTMTNSASGGFLPGKPGLMQHLPRVKENVIDGDLNNDKDTWHSVLCWYTDRNIHRWRCDRIHVRNSFEACLIMQKTRETNYITDDTDGPGIHIYPTLGFINYSSRVCGSFVAVPVNRERAATILKAMRKSGEVFCTHNWAVLFQMGIHLSLSRKSLTFKDYHEAIKQISRNECRTTKHFWCGPNDRHQNQSMRWSAHRLRWTRWGIPRRVVKERILNFWILPEMPRFHLRMRITLSPLCVSTYDYGARAAAS